MSSNQVVFKADKYTRVVQGTGEGAHPVTTIRSWLYASSEAKTLTFIELGAVLKFLCVWNPPGEKDSHLVPLASVTMDVSIECWRDPFDHDNEVPEVYKRLLTQCPLSGLPITLSNTYLWRNSPMDKNFNYEF